MQRRVIRAVEVGVEQGGHENSGYTRLRGTIRGTAMGARGRGAAGRECQAGMILYDFRAWRGPTLSMEAETSIGAQVL